MCFPSKQHGNFKILSLTFTYLDRNYLLISTGRLINFKLLKTINDLCNNACNSNNYSVRMKFLSFKLNLLEDHAQNNLQGDLPSTAFTCNYRDNRSYSVPAQPATAAS